MTGCILASANLQQNSKFCRGLKIERVATTKDIAAAMRRPEQRGRCRRAPQFASCIILLLFIIEIAVTSGFSGVKLAKQVSPAFSTTSSSPKLGSFVPYSAATSQSKKSTTALAQADSPSETHLLGRALDSTRSVKDVLTSFSEDASFAMGTLSSSARAILSKAGSILQQTWWCLPMALSFVPLYSYVFLQSHASMPSWWAVVNMDYLWNSPHARHIVAVFLGSNLSYLVSGLYLLARYRPRIQGKLVRPYGCSLLGTFVLTAGTVSTLFHSVQALGPYEIAEGLCYIDHGVAISSILYFWHRCGRPSRTTAALSAAGMVTLVLSGPGYAYLHSAWHMFSAAAAVVWARDGNVGSRLSIQGEAA